MGPSHFVDVILPLALHNLYTYSVPEDLLPFVSAGKRVAVQFGKKRIYAAIVSKTHRNAPAEFATKDILQVIDQDPMVTEEQLKLWWWMAEYYMCTIGEVMNAALPSGLKMESETLISTNDPLLFDTNAFTDAEAQIFEAISIQGSLSIQELAAKAGVKNPMGVLKSMLDKGYLAVHETLEPVFKSKYEVFARLHPSIKTDEGINAVFESLKRAEAQQRLLMAYLSLTVPNGSVFTGWVKRRDLMDKAGVSTAVLTAMAEKNVFEMESREVSRFNLKAADTREESPLTDFQQLAFNSILAQLDEKGVVLLHGVTSSGKTEIYIKLIAEQLKKGKQVLYLLPEIALTAQIVNRLKQFFGNRVGVYHSKYSDGQRVEIYNGLLSDGNDSAKVSYDVVIGVRSSVFLPFRRLGLVIVDEEHENTLKQFNPTPRYNARDSAIVLASFYNAKVLLGTATPSVETYYNAQTNKYGFVYLGTRFGGVSMPEIKVIDTLIARKKKLMKSIFSPELILAIDNALKKGEQVILFQNRRGYSPFVECDECAWVPQCKHCAVTLTYHKRGNVLACHYCGYTMDSPSSCLACGSNRLSNKGFGTEKVEDELEVFFPSARVGRMDLDTTRARSSYERIISEFEEGRIDILVGTQMVTKGLDFGRVSLVGILNADNMLNFPDFRAHERSFQLMTQVSGRSGRRDERGVVLIQTANPLHEVIKQVVSSDFANFFRHQLAERQQYSYPPYYRIVKISVKHRKPELLALASAELGKCLKSKLKNRVLGPEEPLINRIQDFFIMELIIKLERSISLPKAKQVILEEINRVKEYKPFASVITSIDVDPL